jgi:hypothetical protein
MSTNTTSNPQGAPSNNICTKLKNLIDEKTTSCKFGQITTRVLSQKAIADIATPENIEAYITTSEQLKSHSHDFRDNLTKRIRDHAARLFVLAIVKDWDANLLCDAVKWHGYVDVGDMEAAIHKLGVNITSADGQSKLIRAVNGRALVCAPKITKGKYDLQIMDTALPFSQAVENNNYKSSFFSGGEAPARAWDVELSEEFQDGDFGTTEFVLTSHVGDSGTAPGAVAGLWLSGAYESWSYYRLWKR